MKKLMLFLLISSAFSFVVFAEDFNMTKYAADKFAAIGAAKEPASGWWFVIPLIVIIVCSLLEREIDVYVWALTMATMATLCLGFIIERGELSMVIAAVYAVAILCIKYARKKKWLD